MQTPRSHSIGAENIVQARCVLCFCQSVFFFPSVQSLDVPMLNILDIATSDSSDHYSAGCGLADLADRCQGGVPGTCSAGRIGVTCGECPVGSFAWGDGACSPCAEGNLSLWMSLGPDL